ncbi:MAG: alpha-mannosidase, partial [Bifidobacterium breve]|nr:alpha-mannosidase [Bifidobacterium breve]
ARRAGFDWFLTQKISWNDTTKFPHHSFMWEGIDGTRILTHFPPSDTYCSSMSMRELMYSQRNFLDKDLSRNAILLYGFGDGGGGPTREMTARIRRDHDLAGAPKIEFGTPDQLFDRVRKDIVDDARGETPVFHGELYLELHRGTLTAQQDMKRGCRQEESMLRVVEYLCAVASIKNPGYVYPREELDRIWKTLLLNQFHDILPGSAIAWVHRQAREEYARDIARLRDIAAAAGQAVKEAEPGIATVKHAVIAPYASNPQYSWAVRDGGGTAVEESVIPVSVERGGNAIILDNGRLRVRIEADGTVSSLIDLAVRRELVPSGVRMGRYELLKDEPFHWDAWDIQRDAFLAADTLTDAMVEHVEDMPDGSAAIHVVTRARGVEIHTVITLRPGSVSLDFTADVDWHAVEKFLKVDMPVTVQAVNAQYECQYGLVERPINKNTRSDDAKFESCTHRFVRIADADYAAAVVNASTYGSDVSPTHADAARGAGRGTMVRLSLLSAPLYPDPRTDQGTHSFAWSLVADADMNAVLDEAARLNSPVIGELPDLAPLVSLADVTGTIVLDWVKLADDGSDDLIVRLYEAAGGNATAALRLDAALADAKASVQEVNLMEEPELDTELPRSLAGDEPMPADGAVVSLAPFQLAMLRIRR